MKNIYKHYLLLKKENEEVLYLFKTGIFLICVGEDALFLSRLLHLKLVNFSNESKKCGFPIEFKEKYLEELEYHNISYKIIDEKFKVKNTEEIKKLDMNKISPEEAYEILKKWVNYLNVEA